METAITLTEKDFIQRDEGFWMTAEQLGKWLGYKQPNNAIGHIYKRHETELSPFTCMDKVSTQGQSRDVRLFDEQGCYILAMHANTPEAQAFRYSLSLFLKHLRVNSGRFAEIFEKYEAMRIESHLYKMKNDIYTHYSVKPPEIDRMIELIGVLSPEEISRLYRLSLQWVSELIRCYDNILNDKESDSLPVSDWPQLLNVRGQYTVSDKKMDRNREVIQLHSAGMPKSEIAKRLNLHRNTVSSVIKYNVEVSHVSQ